MKIFSPKEELIKILKGESIGYFPRSIPVFGPIVDIMKLTDSYFPDGNYKEEPMSRLALGAHEYGNWNAIMMPWASTIEMEALGCKVTIKDDIAEYPLWKSCAFNDLDEVSFGKDIFKKGSFPAIFNAIKIVREKIVNKYSDKIPIVGMFQGPFTILSYSLGFDKMFKYMVKETEKASKALNIISELNIKYASKMLNCGADLLLMSDPVAEGLGRKEFEGILVPIYKKINQSLESESFIHICGKTSRIIKSLPESGFKGYSFDYPKLSLDFVKETLGNKMKVIGSVPTVTHLLEGTKEEVVDISNYMMENGTDILAPSCGLPQYTPLENIKAMAEAIANYNKENYGIEF